MKKIKLIGLDLDGTLVNTRKQISDRTKAVIKKAILAGVIVVPATGRPISGIPQELLESIPEIRYVITANGALIVDVKEDKFIYQEGIPYEQALEIIKELKKYDIMIEPYIEGEAYSEKKDMDNIRHFVTDPIQIQYFLDSRRVVDNMGDFVKQKKCSIDKIHLLFEDLSLRLKIWKKLDNYPQFVVTTAHPNNLELNKATVNKGTSLLALGKYLGIQKDEIMACGDNSNDLEMLKSVGLGVAMGNAESEIKEAADFVTLTNDEDGVAFAIEKFILS